MSQFLFYVLIHFKVVGSVLFGLTQGIALVFSFSRVYKMFLEMLYFVLISATVSNVNLFMSFFSQEFCYEGLRLLLLSWNASTTFIY